LERGSRVQQLGKPFGPFAPSSPPRDRSLWRVCNRLLQGLRPRPHLKTVLELQVWEEEHVE